MSSGTCDPNAWSSRPVRPTRATPAYRLKRSKDSRAKCPYSGVCLGHQAIGEAFGGIVDHAGELKHGKTSMIEHTDEGIFAGLPKPLRSRPIPLPSRPTKCRPARLQNHRPICRKRRHHGNATPRNAHRRRPNSTPNQSSPDPAKTSCRTSWKWGFEDMHYSSIARM